jgi:uncharacterized protein YegL
MIRNRRRSSRRERGAVSIVVAIAMVPLIGVLALAVDYGNCIVAQTALQNYVDAKALAHLKEQFGLPVEEVTIEHHVPLYGEAVPTPVLEKGAWRFDIQDFQGFTSVAQPGVPAVQVELPAFQRNMLLGGFFGIGSQELSAQAVSFVRRRQIVIIQDVSGSMSGTKIQEARGALDTLVDYMAGNQMPGDRMGLVSYSGAVDENQSVALDLMYSHQINDLRSVISSLSAGGSTATQDGINRAREWFEANPDDLADQVAILVSDGAPNDPGAAESARDTLCNALNRGIEFNTILVGTTGADQPDKCNGGREYSKTDPDEVRDILFTILSRQKVSLVD